MESSNSSFLIELSPTDNVLIVARNLREGETCRIGGQTFTVPRALGLGHKLASREIGEGEKILKYGAPIGSATRPIARGEHVHLHNLKSDYLPTFTLDPGRKYAAH
jgi:altronate dehydratase small subunit